MAKHKNRGKQENRHVRSSAAEGGKQEAQSRAYESQNQSQPQSMPQGSPAVARKQQRRFGHN